MHNNNIMKKVRRTEYFLPLYICFLDCLYWWFCTLLSMWSVVLFSSPQDLVAGRVFLWPVNPGLQGYKAVLGDERVWSGYGNTIVYTVLGTLIGTAVTFIGAFVLSRKEFPMRRAVNHCFCHHHVFRRRYHSDIFAAEAASHAEYCMVNCITGGI